MNALTLTALIIIIIIIHVKTKQYVSLLSWYSVCAALTQRSEFMFSNHTDSKRRKQLV